MKDFPFFTTENGVASLMLKEIPYKSIAYITLRDTLAPDALLAECVDFCRMAGAAQIYAKGNAVLEKFPLYTSVLRMCCARQSLPEGTASLFPVTEQTLEQWRLLYNENMRSVPNAATITQAEVESYRNKAYFVHRDGTLLGLGAVSESCVEIIISLIPGAGREVLLTLCNAIQEEQVVLEVASANHRAVRLYEKLGFLPTEELACWYDVTKPE